MTQKQRISLSSIRVPLARPYFGGDFWVGIAYGGGSPTRMEGLAPATGDDLSDPQIVAGLAELQRLDAELPLIEWHDGVRFSDRQTGLTIDVVPGKEAPIHYSETASRGDTPREAPALSRAWLNARARQFLEAHEGRRTIEPFAARPTWTPSSDTDYTSAHGRRPRPDDAQLVRLVADMYATGESPRERLADEFGCSRNTADDWIKRARRVAPEYGIDIPAPTRGRGNKRGTER